MSDQPEHSIREPKWNPAERWVWEQIRAGKIADFNCHLGRCELKTSPGWRDGRQLSTAFVRKIFYDKPFADHMPPEGARIVGAWLPEGLVLAAGRLHRQLSLQHSRFEKPIDLSDQIVDGHLSFEGSFVVATLEGAAAIDLTTAKIGGQLNLDGATVEWKLRMNGVEVGRDLFMRGSKEQPAKFADVDLTGAKIGGQLNLSGATVDGELTMDSLYVGQNLFMRGSKEQPAKFADVDLTGAKIDGQLNLDGATVEGELWMNGLEVGQDLLMRSKFRQNMNLERARIIGGIDLSNAVLGGNLIIDNASTGTDLFMQRIRCRSNNRGVTASLRGVHVGATLDLEGATCKILDLSDSRVEGDLRLLSLNWSRDSSISLRNTHAARLYDSDYAWPRQLELEGFTYDRWGGLGENGDTRSKWWVQRKWYRDWFKKDRTYSPQPYEQLAEVLRKAGEPAMAAHVLYEGRERARSEARGWRFIGMTLLNWTIGYGLGLRYFRCLVWIAILTGIGMVVLQNDATVLDTRTGFSAILQDGAKVHPRFLDSFVYSFQRLIPLVEFEKFDQVQLGHCAKIYFFVHRTLGYVLALFLGAGLTGLTQKS